MLKSQKMLDLIKFDLKNIYSWLIRRKFLCIFVASVFAIFLLFHLKPSTMNQAVDHLSSLKDKIVDLTRDSRLLENVLRASYKPQYDGKTIFFHESHVEEDKILALSPRQACSIESAGEIFFKSRISIINFFNSKSQP